MRCLQVSSSLMFMCETSGEDVSVELLAEACPWINMIKVIKVRDKQDGKMNHCALVEIMRQHNKSIVCTREAVKFVHRYGFVHLSIRLHQ